MIQDPRFGELDLRSLSLFSGLDEAALVIIAERLEVQWIASDRHGQRRLVRRLCCQITPPGIALVVVGLHADDDRRVIGLFAVPDRGHR